MEEAEGQEAKKARLQTALRQARGTATPGGVAAVDARGFIMASWQGKVRAFVGETNFCSRSCKTEWGKQSCTPNHTAAFDDFKPSPILTDTIEASRGWCPRDTNHGRGGTVQTTKDAGH